MKSSDRLAATVARGTTTAEVQAGALEAPVATVASAAMTTPPEMLSSRGHKSVPRDNSSNRLRLVLEITATPVLAMEATAR